MLLIGQPTLRRRLKLAVLSAVDQRVTQSPGWELATRPITSGKHLKFAGRSDPLFSDDAIHLASRGYPRAVNNPAVTALIATYAADKAIVDLAAAKSAIAANSE